MVVFTFANFGTVNAPLEQTLIEYGRSPDILEASSRVKKLIAEIESPSHDNLSPEHKLVQATAKLFFGTYAFGFCFDRQYIEGAEPQGLHTLASLPKLPPLTVFERPKEWPLMQHVVKSCHQLMKADKVEEAAVVLEDWMQLSWREKAFSSERQVTIGGYGLDTKNMTMLHLAVNCVGIVCCDLTEKIMDAVLLKKSVTAQLSRKIDSAKSVTMLVESGSAEQLSSSSLLTTTGKSIVVTGSDADNLQGFLSPDCDTLTVYPAENIRAKFLEALETQSQLDCDIDRVRGFRFSTALYSNTATNSYFVLGVYHFKYPKEKWWPQQCAHLLALYHKVLSVLPGVESQSAKVIMVGDSNLQTVKDARETAEVLWAEYSLTFGNSLLASYKILSSKLSFKETSMTGVECVSTSERGRALVGAIGQPSKCVDKSLPDLDDPLNAMGKLESSAKICLVFDSSNVQLKSLFVGDADKQTPSPELPLDHRWIQFEVDDDQVEKSAASAVKISKRLACGMLLFLLMLCLAYFVLIKALSAA